MFQESLPGHADRRRRQVQFVIAPFLPCHQPALGVSSLVAVLHRAGISAGVSYLNIELGASVGWDPSEHYGKSGRQVLPKHDETDSLMIRLPAEACVRPTACLQP